MRQPKNNPKINKKEPTATDPTVAKTILCPAVMADSFAASAYPLTY
jgi:hypothetical protein